MKKLSSRSIYGILGLWYSGIPVHDIAAQYDVIPRRVYQSMSHYKKIGHIPRLKNPGQPSIPCTPSETILILEYYSRYQSSGTVLEQIIERETGIHTSCTL